MSMGERHEHGRTTCAYEYPIAYDGVNGVTSASLSFVPSSLSLLHQVLRQAF